MRACLCGSSCYLLYAVPALPDLGKLLHEKKKKKKTEEGEEQEEEPEVREGGRGRVRAEREIERDSRRWG